MRNDYQSSFHTNNENQQRKTNPNRPNDYHLQPRGQQSYQRSNEDRPRGNQFAATCYGKESIELLYRKYLRVRVDDGMNTNVRVFVIGEAAEVLRGLVPTCQSVIFLVDNANSDDNKKKSVLLDGHQTEDTTKIAVLPYAGRMEFELIDGLRNFGEYLTMRWMLVKMNDRSVVVFHDEEINIGFDQTVFDATGIKIPSLSSNIVIWNSFQMGRKPVMDILELASEANLDGFLEEKDYELFGRLCHWKKYGAKDNNDKRELLASFRGREDEAMWLEAME